MVQYGNRSCEEDTSGVGTHSLRLAFEHVPASPGQTDEMAAGLRMLTKWLLRRHRREAGRPAGEDKIVDMPLTSRPE